MRQLIRDYLISVSLANLCFIRVWKLYFYRDFLYWNKNLPRVSLLATVLDVLIAGLLIFVALRVARSIREKSYGWVASAATVLGSLVAVVINFNLNSYYLPLFGLHVNGSLMAFLVVAILVFLLRKHAERVIPVCAAIGLIFLPFVLVTFAQAFWIILGPAPKDLAQTPAVRTSKANPVRVVWIIFDEMGYAPAFARRDALLKMPEFDRLAKESLMASNAYPPALATNISMPALFTGKIVAEIDALGPAQLALTLPGETKPVLWTDQPNIFSEAHAANVNSAISGFYHPYCHLFGRLLVDCFYEAGDETGDRPGLTVAEVWRDQAVRTWNQMRGVLRFSHLREVAPRRRMAAIAKYESILDHAKKDVADPSLGMILVHLPVPHSPCIYDRRSGQFVSEGESSYLDNLSLADRALGELRSSMESAGLWDRTTVVISADHGWRTWAWRTGPGWTSEDERVAAVSGEDLRVPFIVKFAGKSERQAYDQPFNTVLTKDFLSSVLRNETDAKSAANWLDQHRTIGESPIDGSR